MSHLSALVHTIQLLTVAQPQKRDGTLEKEVFSTSQSCIGKELRINMKYSWRRNVQNGSTSCQSRIDILPPCHLATHIVSAFLRLFLLLPGLVDSCQCMVCHLLTLPHLKIHSGEKSQRRKVKKIHSGEKSNIVRHFLTLWRKFKQNTQWRKDGCMVHHLLTVPSCHSHRGCSAKLPANHTCIW